MVGHSIVRASALDSALDSAPPGFVEGPWVRGTAEKDRHKKDKSGMERF